MNSEKEKSKISPFIAGAIFGATLALALTHKEGRKVTEKIMTALKDALEDFEKKHPDLGGIDWPLEKDKSAGPGHNFPPPPKDYPQKSHYESYFDRE